MAHNFKIFRSTVLPSPLEAYAIYIVAPTAKPDFVEIYVTGSTNSIVKKVIDEATVQGLIEDSISSLSNLLVVDDITDRDALTPTANQLVLVLDATGDTSVASGSATYVYRLSNTSWIKISEGESLDVVLSWANIQNKPTSAVADIDDAVSKRHTHANKTELDKIGEDVNGNFIYNTALPVIAWSSTEW